MSLAKAFAGARKMVNLLVMKAFIFYLGLFLQLFGMAAVGLCLFSGIRAGDYGRLELLQFVGGASIFYLGNFLKKRPVQ